jgi:hypothetical protein
MLECYRFNAAIYEPAKSYLKEAFEHIIGAGGDVRQLTQFAFERFGGMFVPYLCQFLCDVHEGRVRIDGLTETSGMTIVGLPMSAGVREDMIREAAYLRAERRGFSGCTPEHDWCSAEREVDERLAEESVLVGQRQTLVASVTGSRQELGLMKDTITHWLDKNRAETGGNPDPGMPPAQRAVSKKEPTAGAVAQPVQRAQPVRKATGGKKKAPVAAAPGTVAGKAPGRKKAAGKKPASRPSMSVSKRQTLGKKTAPKKKPVTARKGSMAAGRKKADVR